MLYTTGGTRRSVVALDGKTGELIWAHSLREGKRAGVSPRQLSGRGVSYWTDGRGDDRILYVTTGYRLVALNAKTGAPISRLRQGRHRRSEESASCSAPASRSISRPARSACTRRRRSSRTSSSSARRSARARPSARTTTPRAWCAAFDVRTGKLLWTFNTIPRPGEFGNDTWEKDSWAVNGNTGVWTQITVDEELGLVYLPVETPTSDYYGGHRPGNNLFAESLVCVDLKTGQRKWHFQLVHHPLWNYDMSSAPILADITVNGRAIKAVAVAEQAGVPLRVRSRHRPAGVADRRDARCRSPTCRARRPAPTQPFPTKPPAYARNYLKVPDDLIDFTPELRAQALEEHRSATRSAPWMYNPPMLGNVNGLLGAINMGNAVGGTNWPGVAYDPETHTVFAQARTTSASRRDRWSRRRRDFSDIRYVSGIAGRPFREVLGPGDCCAADSPRAARRPRRSARPRRATGAGRAGSRPRPTRRRSAAAPAAV